MARLRAAVEGDCDLRVLRRHPGQTRSYIELLLEVGKRRSLPGPLAAMLSEPYETLERRIRIMTMPSPKRRWIRGGVLAGISAVLTVLACAAPGPTDAKGGSGDLSAASETTRDGGVVQEGRRVATFTPYSMRPEVRNRDEVATALGRRHAAFQEDQGIGGAADVWLYVDEKGRAVDIRMNRSTGHGALDDAAMGVAEIIELTPALNRDQKRAVWVSLPIVFATGDAGEDGRTEIPEVGSVGDPVITEPTHAAAPGGAETGTVTGFIRHAVSDQPLADVQVFVRGTGRGSLSNGEGRFRIDHVPAGERVVVAQLIGYAEISTGVSVAPGESSEADFRLQEAVVALDPLIVR